MFPEVGEVWRTRDAESGSRIDLLWATRFLTGHCQWGRLLCHGMLMSGWHVLGVGTVSLEIIFCGIVEGYPRSGSVCCRGSIWTDGVYTIWLCIVVLDWVST